MNCKVLKKSKQLLSGGQEHWKEDLYMSTDKAQDRLYGRAWVPLWGHQGLVSAPGEIAVCLEMLTKSQSMLTGSSLKNQPGEAQPVNEV